MWNLLRANKEPSGYPDISPYSEILNSDTYSDSSTILLGEPYSRKAHQNDFTKVILVLTHILFFLAGSLIALAVQGGSVFKQLAVRTKLDAVIQRPVGIPQMMMEDLDALGALIMANTTRVYDHRPEYVLDSETADNFWTSIQPGAFSLTTAGGLVSVITQRALKYGLAPSLPSPTHPDESIYQVAVYHSLHCLNRLRHRLFTPANSTKFVFPADITTDEHTIHCVDHIRHALTCQTDISLAETDNYQTWGATQVHHCRDYDAVMGWVDRHMMEGMPGVLDEVRKNFEGETEA